MRVPSLSSSCAHASVRRWRGASSALCGDPPLSPAHFSRAAALFCAHPVLCVAQAAVRTLTEGRVPIERTAINIPKLRAVEPKARALLAEYPHIRNLAEKAFTSYVRSVHLQPNKEIFDSSKLELEQLAVSYGLPGLPSIALSGSGVASTQAESRAKRNTDKRLMDLKEKVLDKKSARKAARAAIMAARAAKAAAAARAAAGGESSSSSSDSDSGSDSDSNSASESAGGVVLGAGSASSASDAEEAEEFLRVKRKRSAAAVEAMESQIAPLDKRYVVPAAKRKKAKINFKRPTGLKTRFDADGAALQPFASLLTGVEGGAGDGAEDGGAAQMRAAMEAFQAETAERLRSADVTDKERDRKRVQDKHKTQRRKERALRQAEALARSGVSVSEGVQLGGGSSSSEESGSEDSVAEWRAQGEAAMATATMEDEEAAALALLQGM